MKRALIVVSVMLSLGGFAAADSIQYGRIVEIKNSVSSYTKYWVVNTPLIEEVTTYTISVQVGTTLLVGTYDVSEQQPVPPPDWTKGYAVKVQLAGNTFYLRSGTGQYRLHLKQRKRAKPTGPLTAEEKKRLDELDAPLDSLIGLSAEGNSSSNHANAQPATSTAPEPTPPAPPPAAPTTGTVTVRSTPYLSEVFVDGASMGYTPAKIALAPGKHAFHIEKQGYRPWTKEITITVSSELTLDATLEKK